MSNCSVSLTYKKQLITESRDITSKHQMAHLMLLEIKGGGRNKEGLMWYIEKRTLA